MGKNAPLRPAFSRNLATLIAANVVVRASCDTCAAWQDIDLPALQAKVGPDYDLWNRRPACRLTPGCQGRNRFAFNGRGRFEPMRD